MHKGIEKVLYLSVLYGYILPDNRTQVLQKAKSLDFFLRKDDAKKDHFLEFMRRIFENNNAEIDSVDRW